MIVLATSLVFSGSLAHASASYEVSCAPQIRFQGSELSVQIMYGTEQGVLTYGNPSANVPVETYQFPTARVDAPIGVLTFQGDGFSLTVDEGTEVGHLQSTVGGHTIDTDLTCDIQEFRPDPGVSMSNAQ